MDKDKKQIIWISVTIVSVVSIAVASYIYRDNLKSFFKKTFGGESSKKSFDENLSWWRDLNTKSIVENLHPKFRNKIAEFFSRVERELGLRMFATSGYRDFNKQAQLHAENPSNAKPGYSSHNYGFAIDLNVIDPKTGKIILKKANSTAEWEKSGIVKIARELGLQWGGGGAFGSYHDPIHFFIEPKGMESSELLALHNQGKVDNQGYVLV